MGSLVGSLAGSLVGSVLVGCVGGVVFVVMVSDSESDRVTFGVSIFDLVLVVGGEGWFGCKSLVTDFPLAKVYFTPVLAVVCGSVGG